MSSGKNPQHSILQPLDAKGGKTAELVDKGQEKASKYAINRAVRGMVENGLAEEFASTRALFAYYAGWQRKAGFTGANRWHYACTQPHGM